MAQEPSSQLGATGKKRSFVVYSSNPFNELVYFAINGTDFYVHKGVLDEHYPQWEGAFHKYAPKAARRTYRLDGPVRPCVFRGFVYWLYYQGFPSNEEIKGTEHSAEWEEGKEKDSLALNMVTELYLFAWKISMYKLANDAITFLFNYYKEQRVAPSVDQVKRIFQATDDSSLQELCVDLYYKFGVMEKADGYAWDEACDLYDELPKDLLARVFHRHCKTIFARSENAPHEEGSFVLALQDYHDWYEHRDIEHDCPCEDPDPEKRYIIK